MDIVFTARVLCDCCLWSAIAGFAFGGRIALPMWAAVLLLAAGASAVKFFDKKKWRLLPLAAPLLTLIFAMGIWDFIYLIPPLAYCVYICASRRFELESESCALYLKVCGGLLLVASVFFAVTKMDGGRSGIYLPFIICFYSCGFAMVRMARLSPQGRKDKKAVCWTVGIVILLNGLAVILSSSGFLGGLKTVFAAFARTIIAPIVVGLAYALGGIGWLLGKLFNPSGKLASIENVQLSIQSVKDVFSSEGPVEPAPTPKFLKYILLALAIAAVIAILILIARRLAPSKVTKRSEMTTKEAKFTPAVPLRKQRVDGAAQQLRQVYRKFMKELKGKGVNISTSDTSEALLIKAGAKGGTDNCRVLRELYLPARYDPQAHIEKNDIKAAKDALKDAFAEEK